MDEERSRPSNPLLLTVCLVILGTPLAALAESRGVDVLPKAPSGVAHRAKQWLLAIGIDKYEQWDPLTTAAKDAKTVRRICERNYFFDEFIELYDEDATRKAIRGKLEFLVKNVKAGDSVLIYYAGHGYIDTTLNVGYWIPVDGDKTDDGTWIPNDLVKRSISAMSKAKHILLVTDSCFAGDFFRGAGGPPAVIDDAYYRRVYEQPSRKVMTSGSLEPVGDVGLDGHSPFAFFFIRALEENAKPYFVPSSLFERIREGVSRQSENAQRPLLGDILGTGGEAGEFIFFRRPEPIEVTETDIPPSYGPELYDAFDVPAETKDPHGNPVRKRTDAKTGWPLEIRHKATGMHLVFVPAGEFQMGSLDGEDVEKPIHDVKITKPFFLGKYEVTQAEWKKVMGSNPSQFQGDSHPVEIVSWEDCQEFLKKLNAGLSVGAGLAPPSATQQAAPLQFALPTEAQWEYACRAGTDTTYSWGNTFRLGECNVENDPGSREARNVETFRKKGLPSRSTMPVGRFKPNAWGLYDMHGNVWEWCSDWYDAGYYRESPKADPRGPPGGSAHVFRGGCWSFTAKFCQSARRDYSSPEYAQSIVGCRVLLRLGP